MPNRPHGRAGAQVPGKGPLAICDRCGFLYYQQDLVWQYDYLGGAVPQSLGVLVCRRTCLDELNHANQLLIIPPDPPPIFNARPEFYDVDETNWLTTEDEDIITTQSDSELITSIPDPASAANTACIFTSLVASGVTLTVAYLDLFNGNPAGTGRSVLSTITGSATRTNVLSSLTTTNGIATNTDVLTVSSASAAATPLNYVAIYDAASGGNLITSGSCSVSTDPTSIANPIMVANGAVVQFNALGLAINLN